jgi:hypothetical protein
MTGKRRGRDKMKKYNWAISIDDGHCCWLYKFDGGLGNSIWDIVQTIVKNARLNLVADGVPARRLIRRPLKKRRK